MNKNENKTVCVSTKEEHPVWQILKKSGYVDEFYPQAEEMYDFIKGIVDITGNITENGETIPAMLKFFNLWNEYSHETFAILDKLVHSQSATADVSLAPIRTF